MCRVLNRTDEGPTATTGSSGSSGSGGSTGSGGSIMTDAPCYKDAQAKFGMWRARF